MGVVISWEVFFPTRARDAIDNGGEVLLNPTNGSSYWLTIVQSQQVASSRLRAIETGRWTLQAAPTGFSAIVTPDGEVTQRTGISEQAVLEQTIQKRQGQTISTIVGPWPTLAWAVLSHRRRLVPPAPPPRRRGRPATRGRPPFLRRFPGPRAGFLRKIEGAGDVDGFEEAAVVGHEEQRALEGGEGLLELLDGLEVEVVGRLVEHQAVDALGHEHGQQGPGALAG